MLYSQWFPFLVPGLILFLFIAGILPIFIYACKKQLCNKEARIEIILGSDWGNSPIWSLDWKKRRIYIYFWIIYISYFVSMLLYSWIGIIINIDWVLIVFFIATIFFGLSSALISYLWVLKKWIKECYEKWNKFNILNNNDFYQFRVNIFYKIYESTENISENKNRIFYNKKILKIYSKNFQKKIKKIDHNDYKSIYFLILKYIMKFEILLYRHKFIVKNYSFIEIDNVLKNIILTLRGQKNGEI